MSTNLLARNNSTQHVRVDFTDGESFHEKHRDSFGGFLNMLSRVAVRAGATSHHDVRSTETADGVVFTVNDRSFMVTNLVQVAKGMFVEA